MSTYELTWSSEIKCKTSCALKKQTGGKLGIEKPLAFQALAQKKCWRIKKSKKKKKKHKVDQHMLVQKEQSNEPTNEENLDFYQPIITRGFIWTYLAVDA